MKKKNLQELRGRKVSKGKGDYTYSDFQKIRILSYLGAHARARIGEFSKIGTYGISTNKTILGRNLEQMIEKGWIIKTISPDSANVKHYTLAEKGIQINKFIKTLRDDEPNHPLFDLAFLASVKSLD